MPAFVRARHPCKISIQMRVAGAGDPPLDEIPWARFRVLEIVPAVDNDELRIIQRIGQ